MRIEMAPNARMAQRGSSLLKLIQNDDLPILDLLIRESVQNSLDASIKKKEFVKFDIGVKKFPKKKLIENMEGINENIDKYFLNEDYEAIYISDSNTQGLTGPLHSSEVIDENYGNLLKLVYEISIPQSKSGAGGSWGLGKTIYFRIGIGLVIYYSRIKNSQGIYENRLAATMVENEQAENVILPYKHNEPKRGIAWWGEEVGDGTTKPIVNPEKIEQFLNIFSIEMFQGEETGTKIIIPFINKDRLLQNSILEDGKSPWWTSNIENYLRVALQKWYAPRINNTKFPYGPWLQASVNENVIEGQHMEPFFKYIQALYRVAIDKEDILIGLKNKEYHIDDISLRSTHNERVTGKVAYLKVSRENLLMNVPHNKPSPYLFINKEALITNENTPILTYVRKPGMIINYETNSIWTNEIAKTDSEDYLIGIFVPHSNNYLFNLGEDITLEDYLRKSEKADHASWYDVNINDKRTTIVSRIQKNVSKAISQKYSPNEKKETGSKKSSLSRNLARSLLPPINFGKSPTINGRTTGGGNSFGNARKYYLELKPEIDYLENLLKIDFKTMIKKSVKSINFESIVVSESGLIKANDWEDDSVIGLKFPVLVKKMELLTINGKEVNLILDGSSRSFSSTLDFSLLVSEKFKTPYGIKIENPGMDNIVEGSIYLQKIDDFVEINLQLSSPEVI